MEIHYSDKAKAPKAKSLDYSGTYTSDSNGYLALVEWHSLRAIAVGSKMPLVHFTLVSASAAMNSRASIRPLLSSSML